MDSLRLGLPAIKHWSLKEWLNFQPKQQQYADLFVPRDYKRAKKFPGYGGAAGGGKSYVGRKGLAKFVLQAHQLYGVRNCVTGLFCEDYPSLKDRQIVKIRQEFPKFLGELKDHRDLGYGFFFKEDFGGGVIALRNLDDPNKYDSAEFAAIFIDEFTKNKQSDLFDQLRKRLRWPQKVEVGSPFPPDFKFPLGWGSNPGGPLHGLAKQYWVDHDIPDYLGRYEKEFVFVQAKATDNEYNPPDYFESLMSLPPDLRAAYAEGNWNIFQGQFFKEWRERYHIVKPFEIPRYWKRGIAVDWGWTSPFCALFFAVSPDGEVYVYHELYGTERLPSWWAERILDQVGRDGVQLADYIRLIDPATAQKDPRFGKPVRELFEEAGISFEYANNDRLSGWIQVREYLSWERNPEDDSYEFDNLIRKPKLRVFGINAKENNAPNLVRTLPVLISDKNRVEDVDTDTEDHAGDTLRYYLMSRPAVTKIPFRTLSQEWQEALLRAKQREQENNR